MKSSAKLWTRDRVHNSSFSS